MCRGAIIECKRFRHLSGRDELMHRRPALGLAIEVGTSGPWKKSETRDASQPVGPGIGDADIEPANRAGADTSQDDPRLPRPPEQPRDLPVVPGGQHALRVAAADEDDVRAEKRFVKIRRAGKQWQV